VLLDPLDGRFPFVLLPPDLAPAEEAGDSLLAVELVRRAAGPPAGVVFL
jgi:hypothetical protein